MFVCLADKRLYLPIVKIVSNLIIKDLCHFLVLFVGQKARLIFR